MRRSIHLPAAVMLMAAMVALTPDEARASCTNSYYLCLNEATFAGGPGIDSLEAIECGAGWVGCVASAMRFW